MVRVWVAPTPNDIMHSGAVFVETVVDGVLDNRRQRPQIGHIAPQSVAARKMCGVYLEVDTFIEIQEGWVASHRPECKTYLPRLTAVEPFVRVGRRPAIHVSDLRTMGAQNPPHVSSRDLLNSLDMRSFGRCVLL